MQMNTIKDQYSSKVKPVDFRALEIVLEQSSQKCSSALITHSAEGIGSVKWDKRGQAVNLKNLYPCQSSPILLAGLEAGPSVDTWVFHQCKPAQGKPSDAPQ